MQNYNYKAIDIIAACKINTAYTDAYICKMQLSALELLQHIYLLDGSVAPARDLLDKPIELAIKFNEIVLLHNMIMI